MRCIVVEKIGSFAVAERDIPSPGRGEVLVKVGVAGLCRTDLKIIRVGHRDLVLPRIPGEEVVGTICEVGGDVRGFGCGQRVYVYPGVWCGECRSCLQQAENLCEHMQIMGFHRDGGFAEYVLAPVQSLIAVPDSLSDDEAVFAEPLSCCLNGLEVAGIEAGKTVGIWGAGPAGTLLHRLALAHGAEPTNIEPDERRRELIGGVAAPPPNGFDICVVAVGSDGAYREALVALNPRGTIVSFSGLPPSSSALPVDFNAFHYHETRLVGAYGCCYRHGEAALDLLAKREVVVEDMISHRLPLWELEEALSVVETRRGMKVLLYP